MGWRMRALFPLFFFSLLAGCGDIPRDPDGSLERIRRERILHVGMVDGADLQSIRRADALIAALAKDTGANPAVTRDGQEALLLRLEAGDLDIVVGGRFAEDTPWKTRVTLGPPLASETAAANTLDDHAVTRNGENAWIVLVQREARKVAR